MSLNNYWPAPWVGPYTDPWDIEGCYSTPLPYDRNARYAFDKWMKEKGEKHKMVGKDKIPTIKRVIFNGDATIVFWTDKCKTVVKRSPNEPDDREKAILTAFAIRCLGSSKGELHRMMKKAFESVTEKSYRWTDISKVRFNCNGCSSSQVCLVKKLNEFMEALNKNFEEFGYISIHRLADLVAEYDILNNGGKPFAMPRHAGNDKSQLVWTNREDFGTALDYDPKSKSNYWHIYIRRSPEPMVHTTDWKGEKDGTD